MSSLKISLSIKQINSNGIVLLHCIISVPYGAQFIAIEVYKRSVSEHVNTVGVSGGKHAQTEHCATGCDKHLNRRPIHKYVKIEWRGISQIYDVTFENSWESRVEYFPRVRGVCNDSDAVAFSLLESDDGFKLFVLQ